MQSKGKGQLLRKGSSTCSQFKLDGKAIKIDGICLDYFRGRGFGLWSCHGGSNQRFSPKGPGKWCLSSGKCVEMAGKADGEQCSADTDCSSKLCTGGTCVAKKAVGLLCGRDAECTTGMCVKAKCFTKQPEGASCGADRECTSNRCSGGSCAKPLGVQLQSTSNSQCIAQVGNELRFAKCNAGDPAQLWTKDSNGAFANAKTQKCMVKGGYAC